MTWWRSLISRAPREYSMQRVGIESLAWGLTGTKSSGNTTLWVTLNHVLKAPYHREEKKRKCKSCGVELTSPFLHHFFANSFWKKGFDGAKVDRT